MYVTFVFEWCMSVLVQCVIVIDYIFIFYFPLQPSSHGLVRYRNKLSFFIMTSLHVSVNGGSYNIFFGILLVLDRTVKIMT